MRGKCTAAADDDAELNDATILRGGSIVIHKSR
jgi:hypothetical protein